MNKDFESIAKKSKFKPTETGTNKLALSEILGGTKTTKAFSKYDLK